MSRAIARLRERLKGLYPEAFFATTWEAEAVEILFHPQMLYVSGDHHVRGEDLFPLALYVEIARRLGAPDNLCLVDKIVIHAGWRIDHGSTGLIRITASGDTTRLVFTDRSSKRMVASMTVSAAAAVQDSAIPNSVNFQPPVDFYAELARHGLVYGQSFRVFEGISSYGSALPRDTRELFQVDALLQAGIALGVERTRQLLLPAYVRSLSITGSGPVVSCRAEIIEARGAWIECNVQGFASDHTEVAAARGILLSNGETRVRQHTLGVRVAASFGCELLERPLKYLGNHVGISVDPTFAVSGEHLKELTDPASGFNRGSQDLNCLLYRVDDLFQTEIPDKQAQIRRTRLGLKLKEMNRYETDYLFDEIFVSRAYGKALSGLPKGAVIVDVGANIGLFTLYAAGVVESPRIVAYEPIAEIHNCLQENIALNHVRAEPVCAAVGGVSGSASIQFFPEASFFSKLAGNDWDPAMAMRAAMDNGSGHLQAADDLFRTRQVALVRDVEVLSFADAVERAKLEHIDLLKLDAEGEEWTILESVPDDWWGRIGRIVVEVHEQPGAGHREIRHLLETRGYTVEVEEVDKLAGTSMLLLHGFRRQLPAAAPGLYQPGLRAARKSIIELQQALALYQASGHRPLVAALCDPAHASDTHEEALIGDEAWQALQQTGSGLHCIRIPKDDLRDDVGVYQSLTQFAAIALTPKQHFLIAAQCLRALHLRTRPPLKLAIVDCDDTLWGGVCGEVGPENVRFGEPHLKLQARLKDLLDSGVLLAICSKNNIADVEQTFRRKEMLLALSDFSLVKANWGSKPDNVSAILSEVGFAPRSVLFIDDSKLECELVARAIPAIMILHLGADEAVRGKVLDNHWGLDVLSKARPAVDRNAHYKVEAERRQGMHVVSTPEAYADWLALNVQGRAIEPTDYARVSELSIRVTQFSNGAPARRQEELRDWFEARGGGRIFQVRDRFGDYGDVGACLFSSKDAALEVEALWLSCRALGRGVELKMLQSLLSEARERGHADVRILIRTTHRNRPWIQFCHSLGAEEGGVNGAIRLAANKPITLRQVAEDPGSATIATTPQDGPRIEVPTVFPDELWALYNKTAIPARLLASSTPPEQVEALISEIWANLLGADAIRGDTNFFDLGGTSAQLLEVFTALEARLPGRCTPLDLFRLTTIKSLAAWINRDRGQVPAASPKVADKPVQSGVLGRWRR